MNYKVTLKGGDLWIRPPIRAEDGEESMVLLVDPKYGDVVGIKDKKGALIALYDELQVNDRLKDGDTFTLRGETKPFAVVEGVDVVPLGWTHNEEDQ